MARRTPLYCSAAAAAAAEAAAAINVAMLYFISFTDGIPLAFQLHSPDESTNTAALIIGAPVTAKTLQVYVRGTYGEGEIGWEGGGRPESSQSSRAMFARTTTASGNAVENFPVGEKGVRTCSAE